MTVDREVGEVSSVVGEARCVVWPDHTAVPITEPRPAGRVGDWSSWLSAASEVVAAGLRSVAWPVGPLWCALVAARALSAKVQLVDVDPGACRSEAPVTMASLEKKASA